MNEALVVTVHASVAEVDRATWDALCTSDSGANPFVRHGFLSALEDAGAITRATGWTPRYLVARAAGRVVGIAPAFIKTHSMGEFVYDWAWADAAQRAGLRYYPKLVIASPFSPVTGRRLLVSPELDEGVARGVRRALLEAALEYAANEKLAGVHLLFALEDEIRLAEKVGFCHRLGAQYHWENSDATGAPYADFEAFIARFPSKRRNQIRRERRRVQEAGVEVRHYVGEQVEDRFIAPAFAFYGATVDRYVWGRRYLDERFFELLWQRMRPFIHLTLAWRGDTIVGGTLDLQEGQRRWGRYWGALADIDSLHFEVCEYGAIEDCIETGVGVFEAGAGGEHKLARGFLPSPTHSAHLLFEPRFQASIAEFCAHEADALAHRIVSLRDEVFVR